MKRFSILLLPLMLAAFAGCRLEARGQYPTHLVLYHRAPADQALLAQYDYIICGPLGYFSMEPEHRKRALLYFNPWGADGYRWSASYPSWQPRPGDLGQDSLRVSGAPGVHLYTWSNAHADSVTAWVQRALAVHPAAGVFLDDWALRSWWIATAEDSAVARKAWPFWPATGWLQPELERMGLQVCRQVALKLGTKDGLVVVNGPWRYPPGVSRMSENAGCYFGGGCRETWQALDTPGNPRYLEPGDFLQVNVLRGDGTTDQRGERIIREAASRALRRQCSLGIAYSQRPPWGGSVYQVPTNSDWLAVRDWPEWER